MQSGLWAAIPETDELLTIDHLIKEGRNITLDQTAPEQRQAQQRRVPLFLMPRDQTDRRKKEFRISSCTVHHTGVYLLQESDARLLDALLSNDDADVKGTCPDGPLVPAPPREVQDLDNRLQELLREMPEEPVDPSLHFDSPTSRFTEGAILQANKALGTTPGATPFGGHGIVGQPGQMGNDGRIVQASADPWALLDEHATAGHDIPMEIGRTSKRLNAKKLLVKAEGLPDVDSSDTLLDDALWGSEATAGMGPMLTAGHPVDSLFLAVAGQIKSGGRYEVQRGGFSAAWMEFEDLFSAAVSRRRGLRAASKAPHAGATPMTPTGAGAEASDDEGMHCDGGFPGAVDPTTPQKLVAPLPDLNPMSPCQGMDADKIRHDEEQRKEVAMLENMIQDHQSKYETTIRNHLQLMQRDGGEADNKRFPEMYANVRKWQEQLEPVLKEYASRPLFDIDIYTTKILTKLTSMDKIEGADETIVPFSDLVQGHNRWEICRRFLTCLMLTNQGNTDILFDNEEERLNLFKIQVLEAEKKKLSLDCAPVADDAPTGRTRKRVSGSEAATQPVPIGDVDVVQGKRPKRARA